MKNRTGRLTLFSLLFAVAVRGQNIQYLPLNTTATFDAKRVNTNLPVGKVDGSVSVSPTGSTVYTIPIQVPPGTREMAPNISVVYNSHGGNGIMGMGWNFTGLSGISRMGKNHPFDNEVTAVQLDNQDLYGLDGNRLEVITGNYGAANSQYATKMETFSLITANGNVANGPEWFKVETKAGLIYEYGNSADSKLMSEDGTKILAWQLNKTYDRYGNYMEYVYEMTGSEQRLAEINYTGNVAAGIIPYNKIKFNYSYRADRKKAYIAGNEVGINSLLTSIVMTTENNAIVRKYNFNYGFDEIRSFLTEVIEVGAENNQLNSTIFKYGDPPAPYRIEDPYLGIVWRNPVDLRESKDFITGDFNGDGKTDVMAAVYTSTDRWSRVRTYDKLSFCVSDPAQANKFTHKSTIALPSNSAFVQDITTSNFKNFLVSNFNGDNRDDILLWEKNGQTIEKVKVYCPNEDATDFNITECPVPSNNFVFFETSGKCNFVGDFDGDGVTDYALVLSNRDAYKLFMSFPIKKEYNTIVKNPNNSTDDFWATEAIVRADAVYTLDFNGDGKLDIMTVKDLQCKIYTFQRNANGNLQAVQLYDSGFPTKYHTKILFGDFNGDGKTDILTKSDIWRIAYSDGTKFREANMTLEMPINIEKNLFITDVNGDGLSDIVYAYDYSPSITINPVYHNRFDIYYSRGGYNNFQARSITYPQSRKLQDPLVVGDFNGDGRSDILNEANLFLNASEMIYFQPNGKELLLDGVMDGFIQPTTITHKLLTDKTVYTNQNNAVYPLRDMQVPIYVTSSVSTVNAIGGFNTTNYKYEGAKLNRVGGGFLGFNKVQTTNETFNTAVTDEYEILTPQYVTAVKQQTVKRLDNSALISQSRNTNLVQLNQNRYWLKVTEVASDNFVTGTNTISRSDYDAFGNVTSVMSSNNNVENTWTGFSTYAAIGTPYPSKPAGQFVLNMRVGNSGYVAKSTEYSYNTKGDILQATQRNGTGETGTTTAYEYLNVGLVSKITLSCANHDTKTTLFEYDAKKRFQTKVTNPLNQATENTYDSRWGTVLTSKDISGQTTGYNYDEFGRLRVTVTAQGQNWYKEYRWAYNGAYLPVRCYDIITTVPGKPQQWDTYDVLNRKIVATQKGYGSASTRWVYAYVLSDYDARGNLASKTTPFHGTEYGNHEYTRYQYDALNRLEKMTVTNLGESRYAYAYNAGKTTVTVTSPAGQVTSKTTDATGKVVETTDLGGTMTFDYDHWGNNTAIKLAGQPITTMEYDSWGRQKTLMDKNAGTTQYVYNQYGELKQQTDANGSTYNMMYDILGRLMTRTGPEGTTSNEYVTTGNGINQLKKVTGFNGINQEYVYDGWHRVSQAKQVIDNTTYTKSITYNAFNDVETVTYPSGLAVRNTYSPDGYLIKVAQDNGQVFFDGTDGEMNGFGKWKSYKLGNNKTSTTSYNKYGMATRYQTPGVQDLNLNWQLTTGNLLSRTDAIKSKTETFTYDDLNRLKTAQVNGLQSYATNFETNGNITNKSDAGTYQYDPLKIHALAQLTSYNNVSTGNQDVVYTKFQRPEKITENGNELTYLYAADYERQKAVLKTNGAIIYTRLYFGDYEMTTRNGLNQYVHYIAGGDGLCAIAVKDGNSAFHFYVPYSDHLGSILTITNTSGSVIAEQNFDAWGRKRNATTWDYANVAPNPTWLYRGYTGHEHLPEFNLINMNARLYDPVLGRMLSPDNYVSVGGSQGMNRYTYSYNNPTKYADLDGNCPICIPMAIGAAIGAGVDIGIQWYSKGWSNINWYQVGVSAAAGAVGGGAGALVGGSAALATSSAVVQGAISGAVAGAASGLVSGVMNGQRGWDLAKTVGISAGVGAAVGAGAAYIKGRFFPPKTKGGIPSEPEPGKGGRYNGASELIHLNRVETSTGVTGTLEAAEIGEVTVLSKTIEVPTGQRLALGLQKDLSKFTDWLGGINYMDLPVDRATPHNIFKTMANPNNTLHYNLTNFNKDLYQSYINSPHLNIDFPTGNNYSNWELFHIYSNKWLNRVTFYEYVKPQSIFGKGTYRVVPPPF